jgi:hypothetical protein
MMTTSHKEKDISLELESCLRAIVPNLVRKVTVRRAKLSDVGWWDAELIIKTQRGEMNYAVEVKPALRPEFIKVFLSKVSFQDKYKPQSILLFSDYVNPILGQQLQQAGINFIDRAGNIFLKHDRDIYVSIEGKKPAVVSRNPSRLSQPKGLILLFGLLVEPKTVNWAYRQLSRANGLSIGTVGWIKHDLREEGYLVPIARKTLRLIRRKELLDRWVLGYRDRLRPRLLQGTFREASGNMDEVLSSLNSHAQSKPMRWGLTGGFGADSLIHHYRGTKLTVMVEDWSDRDSQALRWLPSKNGPITILKAFSTRVYDLKEREGQYPLVHPLSIYAELLYSGSDRDLETAEMIYKELLEPTIVGD